MLTQEVALDTFYLKPEELQKTPSRQAGIDAETEKTLRIFGCDLIQEAGILLGRQQAVMCTGQVLLQRFYCKKSLKEFNVRVSAQLLPCKFRADHAWCGVSCTLARSHSGTATSCLRAEDGHRVLFPSHEARGGHLPRPALADAGPAAHPPRAHGV